MKFQNSGGEYFKVQVPIATVPTAAGSTDGIIACPFAGILVDAVFSATDALAADDTNYATFAIANLNNSNAAMLEAANGNTSKATGGSALTAHGKRRLTLQSTTPANLATSLGDRLRCRVTGAGTLANTLTQGVWILTFRRTGKDNY
jgi:hypothetical protein